MPSRQGTQGLFRNTHQVPLLRELGICGLQKHISLGPAFRHLLLQPVHLRQQRRERSEGTGWQVARLLPSRLRPQSPVKGQSGPAEELAGRGGEQAEVGTSQSDLHESWSGWIPFPYNSHRGPAVRSLATGCSMAGESLPPTYIHTVYFFLKCGIYCIFLPCLTKGWKKKYK